MSNIVIISGSPNATSRLNGIIDYVRREIEQLGHTTKTITVVSLPPDDLVHARFGSAAIVEANRHVEEASAVIIASPVYKASYTGVLKAYVDLLPQKGLEGKLVAPLFIGGTLAHLLSIDYSLKPVLSSMGARHFVRGVYATDELVDRIQDGTSETKFELKEELRDRLQAAVQELHEELQMRADFAKQSSGQ
ncbi:NADPH-dependent FMN reductase [Paenibacillus sp. LHD-117]|uniref:NADPH-dependent FMN reductase n=1 Tax=Paenibacillus sp. LHD-117 TaxID=3071412 RepID=UPI0027E1D8F8|nr:NADPH-dependent FMN reductase [Paenibacillus sp. LHD-117]MDQ6422778.1 NADPH-dependent FMN reductase [Paenibacillus sp. LHD-117]